MTQNPIGMNVCPDMEPVILPIIPKKGGYQKHIFGDGKVITAATCKAEGKKEFTCLVCGYTKTEVIPQTSQHSYDTGTVTKQLPILQPGKRFIPVLYAEQLRRK